MPTPEEEAAATKAAEEKAAADAKAEQEAADKAAEEAKAKEAEAKLNDPGKAALDSERKARRDADKRAKDAEAKLKELEDAALSDFEKEKKRADDAEAKLTDTVKVARETKLLAALMSVDGIADPRLAAKVIEGVEFDDNHEPTNVEARAKAALETHPLLAGKRIPPVAPKVDDGPSGGGGNEQPALTSDEVAMAKSFAMTPEEYQKHKDPTYRPPAPKPEPAAT